MKKGRLWVSIVICAIILGMYGCDSENKTDVKSNVDTRKITFDELTDEQKDYLTQVQLFTEDAINNMEYEAINWELLGTGFELYNQSSGVEDFGLSYSDTNPISEKSTSEDVITFEEVVEIRKKEKDMRLNDFAAYKYTLEAESNNRYTMCLPLADYEDTYVNIHYTKGEDNVINMQTPYIRHDMKGEADSVFSILYGNELMRQHYEVEPKYTLEGKVFIDILYTTVTENSLVVEVYNGSDKELKLVPSYKIYEKVDGKEVLIASGTGEQDEIEANTYSIESVVLQDDVKLEKNKKYLFKFGEDKWGHFYDEIEFIRE